MFTEADRRLAELVADHHNVFTRVDAKKAGLTDHQIDDRLVCGHFVQLHVGVLTFRTERKSFVRDLKAAELAGGDKAFASGRSAARLQGLPTWWRDDDDDPDIEISCQRWKRVRFEKLIVHERLRVVQDDLIVVDDIRCSGPELTLIDAAAISQKWAEQLFHAMRRKRIASYRSIEEVFRRYAKRGKPGIAGVRKLLEQYSPDSRPTDNVRETVVLQLVRKLGFPVPEPQVVVRDASGRFVGRADFGYRDEKIVLLYHSREWHQLEVDEEYDDNQRNDYQAAGWLVVIIRRTDVNTGGKRFAASLREAFAIRRREALGNVRHSPRPERAE